MPLNGGEFGKDKVDTLPIYGDIAYAEFGPVRRDIFNDGRQ